MIEIMVVISIIGLLGSVVVATIQTSRGKAIYAAGQIQEHQVKQVLGPDIKSGYEVRKSTDPDNLNKLYDTSGLGNDATIHGAQWVPDYNLEPDEALEFDDSSDYVMTDEDVDMGDSDGDGVDGFTVGARVHSEDFSTPGYYGYWGVVVSQGSPNIRERWDSESGAYITTATKGWSLQINAGRGVQLTDYLTNENIYCTTKLEDEYWHYILATRYGSYGAIFIDGRLCKETNSLTPFVSRKNHITIGSVMHDETSTPQWPFKGRIDDVTIYNEGLE